MYNIQLQSSSSSAQMMLVMRIYMHSVVEPLVTQNEEKNKATGAQNVSTQLGMSSAQTSRKGSFPPRNSDRVEARTKKTLVDPTLAWLLDNLAVKRTAWQT